MKTRGNLAQVQWKAWQTRSSHARRPEQSLWVQRGSCTCGFGQAQFTLGFLSKVFSKAIHFPNETGGLNCMWINAASVCTQAWRMDGLGCEFPQRDKERWLPEWAGTATESQAGVNSPIESLAFPPWLWLSLPLLDLKKTLNIACLHEEWLSSQAGEYQLVCVFLVWHKEMAPAGTPPLWEQLILV